jgi:hypothetical protein
MNSWSVEQLVDLDLQARQVAAVSDIEVITVLLSRDATAAQLAGVISSNENLQNQFKKEHEWAHGVLQNFAQLLQYVLPFAASSRY